MLSFSCVSPVGHGLPGLVGTHPLHPGSDWWQRVVLALHSLQGVCTLFIPALAKMNTIMISHGN